MKKEEIINQNNSNDEIIILKNKISQLEKEKLFLNSEVVRLNNALKKRIIQNEKIIEDLKIQIDCLIKKNEILENIIYKDKMENRKIYFNEYKEQITKSMKKLENKNVEIKQLISYNINDLKDKEKLITIILISNDQQIHCSMICKNTEKFIKIEQLLFEKYPEYKGSNIIFLFKGQVIDKDKTLEENRINSSDIVTLAIIDPFE